MKLANTVQSPSISKSVTQVSSALFTKVREIAAFSDDSAVEGQKIFDSLLATLVESYSQVEGASKEATYKLTSLAAQTLFTLAVAFLTQKAYKVVFSVQLAKVLVSITSFINDCTELFVKKTLQTFNLIKALEGYDQAAFVEQVLDSGLIRFTYLALLNDPQVLISLEKPFTELVMNDKQKSAWRNLLYFVPFLARLDSASFFNKIFPEIEFMMNRNGSLISVIGGTVAALTFPFSPEFALRLSSGIFSDEYLVKEENVEAAREYFGKLAAKLTTKEALSALVSDFLVKKFVETRNSSLTGAQRLAIIQHICKAFKNARSMDLIDQELVKHVISIAVEFFYIQKDEAQLKEAFGDILKLFSLVESAEFLKTPLSKCIAKASNIWHVNLLTDLMIAKTKDLGESVQLAAGHFKTLLNGENFKTITTYSQILALVGFFS